MIYSAFSRVASFVLATASVAWAADLVLEPAKLPATVARPVDFEKEIKPIFENSCLKCHGSEKPKGKYSMHTRESALATGENGTNIVPGDSGKSPLVYYAARLIEEMEMPPKGKGEPLTKDQVSLVRGWIDQGAKWPTDSILKAPVQTNSLAVIPSAASRKIDFVKDVEPLFKEYCYECHGAKKQEAGFRLDSKSVAFAGGDVGVAIVPGRGAESLLVQLVSGVQPDKQMPQKGEPLTPEQVGVLRAWIDQGANWPDGADPAKLQGSTHWAFKAPIRPALPKVRKKDWVRNAVDTFVLSKLESEKLSPSIEADKITLLRRLSLDLIGLPPSLAEVDAFLADHSPNAYQDVVERLLASPHYGERWGRHWLDAARYADTNGYEKDQPRNIWPYRDWVIDAFNRDLPFNQFTIEQIAGDLLPNATLEQRVATGFLRNSMLNEEGGVDPEQFRVESIIDRVDTMGKTFFGLSIACAQCHNHKYDPISQREYYQFFAFLNNDDEPEIELPTAEQQSKRKEILSKTAEIEGQLLANDLELAKRQEQWEQEGTAQAGDWQVLEMSDYFGAIGVKFEKQDDQSLLALAHNPGESSYVVKVKTTLTNITGFRLEALTDPNLPRLGPGRSKNGNFVLQEFTVEAMPLGKADVTNKVALQNATADFSQIDFDVSKAIDGDVKTGWGIAASPADSNQDRKAVFQTKEPVGFENGTQFTFTLFQKQGSAHTLGRFRLSATTNANPKADPLPARVRAILSRPDSKRTQEEKRLVFAYYRTVDPKCADANNKIAALFKEWPIGNTTLALLERKHRRATAIFRRGDFRKPGDPVQPGVPTVLHPLPADAPRNRLALAKWIVDPKNPLTPRVIVNRIWQAYFGQGLVTTPEDFGTRADLPSHPELLDWLACEFRDGGWSTKKIHRLIVNSATYRQSSKVTPELYEVDQYNRWLARGPRVRVEAEVVRDIALSAAGLLSPKVGGPSVYPPIPDGVLSLGYGAPMKWETSTGEDRYRRGMYTFWKRSVPYPGLSVFDAPNADFACVRRVKSNTPLQALTTLNDTVFHEAAQALALRVWKDGGKTREQRAEYAFRLCTARKPDDLELKQMLKLVEEQEDYFENRTAAAVQVSAQDMKNPPPDVNLHKVAAWTMVARVLLNMDETITKE